MEHAQHVADDDHIYGVVIREVTSSVAAERASKHEREDRQTLAWRDGDKLSLLVIPVRLYQRDSSVCEHAHKVHCSRQETVRLKAM